MDYFKGIKHLPHLKMPEIKVPEIKVPEIKVPDIKVPEFKVPDIKVSDVRKLYTDSLANLREEGSHMLTLISCNLYKPKKDETTIYERRTIQSNQISTISSLVEKSNCTIDGLPSDYNAQRDNYGLYALKYNRSSTMKRNLMANLLQDSTRINSHPTRSLSPIHDVNHEAFSPCQASHDNHDTQNSLCYNREYYKIEFSAEGGLREVSRKYRNSTNFDVDSDDDYYDDIDGCDAIKKDIKSTQIAPPRKKRIAPQPSICSSDDGGFTVHSKPKQKIKLTKRLLQNDLSFSSNESSDLAECQENSNYFESNLDQLNLQKNKSELYRIRDRAFSSSIDSETSCRNQSTIRRHSKQLVKQSSATESVNIFRKNNNGDEDAFDNFSDALSLEPVISVKTYNHQSACEPINPLRFPTNFNETQNSMEMANSHVIQRQNENDNNSQSNNNNNFDAKFIVDQQTPEQTDEGDGLCIQMCSDLEMANSTNNNIEQRFSVGNRNDRHLPNRNVYRITNLVTV